MDVLKKYAGVVPGFRRALARGIGFRGQFTATADAAALITAEHFQGDAIPVVVRLSNGSGNPYQNDRASTKNGSVLGLAVRFGLPSGGVAAWASLSVKAFLRCRRASTVRRPGAALPLGVLHRVTPPAQRRGQAADPR